MPISELLLPEFDEEMKKTRTTLERVPADKPDFAPHPKSMPLGKLAPHVAQLAGFGITVLTAPGLDFATGSYKPVPLESAAQLVKLFDEGAAKVRSALAATPDEAWKQNWKLSLRRQDHLRGDTFSCLPADVPQPHRASPRPARRIPASERPAGAVHLRPVRG